MNDQMKKNIRGKVNSYLNRAKEIADIRKNGPVKKKAVAATAHGLGNSKDNKADDDDSDDPDRKRVIQGFERRF
jgi:hypothetical protein